MPADEGEVTLAKDKTIGYLAQYQDVSGHRTIYEEVSGCKTQTSSRWRSGSVRWKTQMNALSQGRIGAAYMDSYHKLSHEFEQLDGYAYRSEVTGILKGLGFSEE